MCISAGEAEATRKNPSEKKPARRANITGLYHHSVCACARVRTCVRACVSSVGLVRKHVALPLRNS